MVAAPGREPVTHTYTCDGRSSATVACIVGDTEHRFVVTRRWSPVPSGVEVSGFHEDVAAQLAELGYLDE